MPGRGVASLGQFALLDPRLAPDIQLVFLSARQRRIKSRQNALAAEMRVLIRSNEKHFYEVRPRKDKRDVNLISDVLPFGRLWYGDANAVANAIGYAEHYSRSHDAVIRVYDQAGNVIETHEHKDNNLPDVAAPGGFQAAIRQMLP